MVTRQSPGTPGPYYPALVRPTSRRGIAMKRVTLLGVPLAIVLAVVMSGSALAAATHDVSIANFAFSPASTKAKLGDTVRWTNHDGFAHTSTSDGVNDGSGLTGVGLWASGSIAGSGGTFSYTFTFAGTYPF